MGGSLRRRNSKESRQAARRKRAPAGAKGWLRVSMCQIASVSLRERSIWATLGPRWRPRRLLGALVALGVDGVVAGVQRGFEQRPAQVARALLGDRAAPVAGAGLVDARAEAGVAAELGRRGEALDVADL